MSTTCCVCHRPLPSRAGRPGRPSEFCPPHPGQVRSDCARLSLRFNEIAVLVRCIAESSDLSTDEGRRALQAAKSYLWKETNSATNRGRLLGAADRRPYKKTRSGWWRACGTRFLVGSIGDGNLPEGVRVTRDRLVATVPGPRVDAGRPAPHLCVVARAA